MNQALLLLVLGLLLLSSLQQPVVHGAVTGSSSTSSSLELRAKASKPVIIVLGTAGVGPEWVSRRSSPSVIMMMVEQRHVMDTCRQAAAAAA